MSSAEDRLAELYERLRMASRPGLAKTRPPTYRETRKHLSRQALQSACLAISPSVREQARILKINERYLRDMLEGRRNVQAWIYFALPRAAKLAWIECEIDAVEADESSGQKVA